MKKGKRLFAIFAFVMLGLFAFAFASVTKVHAESGSVAFSSGSYDETEQTITWANSSLTIVQDKGTNTSAPSSAYISAPRWYANHVITFTPGTNYTITSMVITCTSNTYATALNNSTWSVGSSSVTNKVVTWTGSADGAFTLTPNAQTRISTLTYTYVETVAPTSISIPETLELNVGTTSTLSATVLPANASNKVVEWSSNDESIATVDENGLVTAVAAGTTTITATVKGTQLTDTCSVTVVGTSQVLSDFIATEVQEQLAFHYAYNAECEKVSAPVEGEYYFFGSTGDFGTHYATNTISNKVLVASSDVSQAESFTFIKSDDYYLIATHTKYLGINANDELTSMNIEGATVTDRYLWSYDSTNGAFTNKDSSKRYIGFSDNGLYNQIKTYATSHLSTGKYPIATLLTTNGGVTVTDKASNTDAVTMRIGYTISKEMYNEILELDSNAEFGLYLNNTHYEACNAVEVDENTYRFYVAVNGITAANYTTVLTACGYVSVDNDIYYTTDVNEYSVKTLALEYITNHLDNEQVADAEYALRYLAYYA